MTSSSIAPAGFDRHLLATAVVLGLVGGLIEGVGHIVIQKLDILENTWYPIIWIASLVNGALVGSAGLVAGWLLGRFPRSASLRTAGVFLVALFATVPVLAQWLKEWIHSYALLLLALGISTAFTRWYRSHEPQAGRRFRRALPWAVTATTLAILGIQGGFWLNERMQTRNLPAASAQAPNVLLVIIDTLRADHLSAYGYRRQTSPVLDRLAAEGVLFENAIAAASYTLPSHASILTGRYPRQHGIEWDTSHHLEGSTTPTLGAEMQRFGYRTGAFSANRFYFAREHGFGRGFLHFEDYFQSVIDSVLRTAYGRIFMLTVVPRIGLYDLGRKRAPDVTEAVLDWTAQTSDRPFLAVLNYMDAHGPYTPPQPYRSKFSTKPNPGGLLDEKKYEFPQLTPEQVQDEIDAYDGSIFFADEYVGRLLTALRARPSTRDLLVVITSDHGEEFLEHGGFIHDGNLYRESIHVPLIVWRPGHVPSGRRVARPVSNASIPATIIKAIGGEADFLVPALQPLWSDAPPSDWPFPLSELKRRPWAPPRDAVRDGSVWSLVSPEFHYIENDRRPPELFDWVADPREATNLADRAEHRETIARFRELLR